MEEDMKWVLFMVLISKGGYIETYEFNTEASCEIAAEKFDNQEGITSRFRFAFCAKNPEIK